MESEINRFQLGEDSFFIPSTAKNEILEFKNLEEFLIKAFTIARQKTTAERELAQVAAQAAHDICSPLMALQITYEQIPNLSPEQSNFLKKANASISEIAHNLLAKYSAYKDLVTDRITIETSAKETIKDTSENLPQPTNITNLVEDFIELKKVQFSNIKNISITKKINDNTKKLLSKINATQLQRILSNITNNAVEAITAAKREEGLIEINLDKMNHFIVITISDNGSGMSQDVINKLGTHEFSEGKKGGHGIGLFSAIKQIKLWHGNYKITSEINHGTKFAIFLPIV